MHSSKIAGILISLALVACSGGTTGSCNSAGGTCENTSCIGGVAGSYDCGSNEVCCLPAGNSDCVRAGGTCVTSTADCTQGEPTNSSCSDGTAEVCCQPLSGSAGH